jgi:hypothetical protein
MLISRVRMAATSNSGLKQSPGQDPNGAAAASPTTAAPGSLRPRRRRGKDRMSPHRNPASGAAPAPAVRRRTEEHMLLRVVPVQVVADLTSVGVHLNDPYAERRTTFFERMTPTPIHWPAWPGGRKKPTQR